jgi:hypothetical protein
MGRIKDLRKLMGEVRMIKLEALRNYLEDLPDSVVETTLSFDKIEEILEPSSRQTFRIRSWWSTSRDNSPQSYVRTWRLSDWMVERVNHNRKWVCFRRRAHRTDD